MATKAIRIDMEAYRRLQRSRQNNESFSRTIKRIVHEPVDFQRWMASVEQDPLSDKAVAAVERAITQRRSSRNQRPASGAA